MVVTGDKAILWLMPNFLTKASYQFMEVPADADDSNGQLEC
jgi:hypothetical protein